MKGKNYLVLLMLTVGVFCAKAQETPKKEKFDWLNISGFISHSVKYDSRQTVNAREGEFLLYPKPVVKDELGNDVNAFGKLQMFNLHSRMRFSMTGFKFNGFQTSGVLEFDFFGTTDANSSTARLRHAFIQLKNDKIGFLLGQAWHPTFITSCFPGIIAWGAAVPIQPFSRAPQFRFTYTPSSKVELSLSALSQRDFSDRGPNGASGEYLRNAGIPEFQARLITSFENGIMAGVVGGYKTIAPRLKTDTGLAHKETASSYNIGGFAKYSNNRFLFKCYGTYGENLTNLLLIGGYGVKSIDPETDYRTYENSETLALWSEVEYKINEWSAGFFVGHVAAPDHENKPDVYYGFANDLTSLTRWSPRIAYSKNKLKLGVELATTTVNYADMQQNDQFIASHNITNYRYLFTTIYKF
ncbi:hypothetical protein [Carboxylicivirga linearis]|uniref:Porin n=1 Tax=Carboxylicivirga linearis TaxID=1628157 RepID=A0ABS5K0Y7_9BACT|nr:hypothetical protein [Carboxylicivirga linearis]MBS2100211.1 hypothetical protein [Carboxylicivirga linearis]